jgi:hypothetical protein
VPLINAITGSLHHNDDYNPALLPAPQFSVSKGRLYRDSTYYDLIDGEDKRVLDALVEDPTSLAFKVHTMFYVISERDMNNIMNDPNVIKYECLMADSMSSIERRVPYFSMNSIGIPSQGAVPLFDLWTATHSPNKVRTYELVKTARRLPSTASHNVLYNSGARMSAAHCQAGQDAYVYELRILPVDSRSKASATATRIQSAIRGHQSRARALKAKALTNKARTKALTNKARTNKARTKARSWSGSSNQRHRSRTRRSNRHSK